MGFGKNQEETRYQKKYDVFNNMEHRKMIREFEKRFGNLGFFPALVKLQAARYSKMHPEGAVNEYLLSEINDVAEKFKACNDLISLDEFAANERAQMSLPEGAEEAFDPEKASKKGLEEMMKGLSRYMASDKYKGSPATYNLLERLEAKFRTV